MNKQLINKREALSKYFEALERLQEVINQINKKLIK